MNKKQTATVALFESVKIRRTWHEGKWWFSVIDVCAALTDSVDAGAYWRKLKQRLAEESSEIVTFCHGLKLEAIDGKKYTTDCADKKFSMVQNENINILKHFQQQDFAPVDSE